MSATETVNRTNSVRGQSKMNMPEPGESLPYEASGRSAAPIQSRRRIPTKWPPEKRDAEVTRPPLSLKTSPTDIKRSPQHEHEHERQPHSAYTYNTFPSISPKSIRDTERRNSTWAVPRGAHVSPSIVRDDNPRCNILYVSNLPMETSEGELKGIFSSQPGYQRMSLNARANGPSCYVEFDDVTSAAKALRNLYGWPLKNSKMGGIRLSFSKDHFGTQPPQVPTPRTPRRAPPPLPLILPVRSPPSSVRGFATTRPAPAIPIPDSSSPSIEVDSVSSPSTKQTSPELIEDKSDVRSSPVEAETGRHSQHLAGQDRSLDDLAMHTVRGPDYKVETFDECRLWLERAVEMELDWFPLPPIKQPLRLSQSRLVWTYNGMPMSIYLDEDETQRCSGYLEDIREAPQISKPKPPSENPTITYARRVKAFAIAWARIVALSWPNPRSGRSSRKDDASHGSDTAQRLECHLCIEKYPTSTQEATLVRLGFVEQMEDDFEFFVRARRILGEAEGSWIRQLLPWSYHQVKLKKFQFPSNGSNQVQTADAPSLSDPRDIWGGYEFKGPQAAEIDVHMRVYSHILLQGIRYPEIGRGSRTLLDGIPKHRTPLAFEKETLVYGWGFYVRQSLSMPKIVAGAVITTMLGLIFVPFFMPLSLITGLFMLFILKLGRHTELRL